MDIAHGLKVASNILNALSGDNVNIYNIDHSIESSDIDLFSSELNKENVDVASSIIDKLSSDSINIFKVTDKIESSVIDFLDKSSSTTDKNINKELFEARNKIIETYKSNGALFIATLIFKISQKYVPVDTGRLKKSGKIVRINNGNYSIVYDTPYALRQHEELNFGHKPPGRAKYLEDAAYEVYNLVQDTDESPLFTFEIKAHEKGKFSLNINNIDVEQFIKNKNKRDRLLSISTLDDLDDIEEG